MAGLNAGRSLRLAPLQRAEAFDFGTCKTPRNADGITRWCLKALPRNFDGTNHNLKSRIFRQTIQKFAGCSRATGKDFCEV